MPEIPDPAEVTDSRPRSQREDRTPLIPRPPNPAHHGKATPTRSAWARTGRCSCTTSRSSRSSPDTWRDVRGFALEFYTQDGNFDIVGNNTPTFFVRDPMKFPDFIHSQKRTPDSGLRDNNTQWDFWALSRRAPTNSYDEEGAMQFLPLR